MSDLLWTNLVDKTVSGQTNEIPHHKDVIIKPTLLGGGLETWLCYWWIITTGNSDVY